MESNRRVQLAIDFDLQFSKKVGIERAALLGILHDINRAQTSGYHLDLGFGSLYHWLTEKHGYSETSALTRLKAASLLKSVPDVEQKIESGQVNLSTLSKTAAAIRAEEKRTGTAFSAESKLELIQKIENKTGMQVERTLKAEFPDSATSPPEKVKVVAPQEIQLQITLKKDDFENLSRAKEVLSHALPFASFGEIIAFLAEDFLNRKDPLRKPRAPCESPDEGSGAQAKAGLKTENSGSEPREELTLKLSKKAKDKTQSRAQLPPDVKARPDVMRAGQRNRRELPLEADSPKMSNLQRQEVRPLPRRHAISAQIRRAIFQRDRGRCQYRRPGTSEVCGSRFQVEVDHVEPLAVGGSDDFSNLRCLCRSHNQRRGQVTFGIYFE